MCDSVNGVDTLIADLCDRWVWEPQTKELFDIRVVDTDAWSYCARSPQDVLHTAEADLSESPCHIYSSLCFCGWHARF